MRRSSLMLESLYDENINAAYEFKIDGDVINYKDAFIGALNDPIEVAATAFINGISNLTLKIAKMHNITVVLFRVYDNSGFRLFLEGS